MRTIGILGGGQLGGMLSEALYNYGAKIVFYDPDPLSPSFHKSANHYQGDWNDAAKLEDFFRQCDLVTYEFENVATDLLNYLIDKTKKPLFPAENVLKITQNRISEKSFLKQNNLPVCKFIACTNLAELTSNAKEFPFPFIIKTAFGGYDGKGQWVIQNQSELEKSLAEISLLGNSTFIIEEKIDIFSEASCIVARNKKNEIECLPIFDNIHKNQILYQTNLPSQLPTIVQKKLQDIAIEATEKLDVIGLLTTEFFISKQKNANTNQDFEVDEFQIYINEFAPRPHNSGHISRVACSINQYDLFARVLLDLPLHTPKLYPGYFCMGNLLGSTWIKQKQGKNLNLSCWKDHPNIVSLTLYGKESPTEQRKMGHFVCHADNIHDCNKFSENFRKDLNESD
ncbi:5-(carboxyamino)imidazole ribonucleotide synthase [Pigmentibacter ruber]|uniref:5-(carboxyamino)imidazole ribonucleotide synthase n=1 Tax=Pigmentibacter ruber TaxID=2683196 RepID=UPI00131E2DFC|nr:ATP-grasp domain-containing protein [Pigmentibacter ruber]BFD32631.1 5-(carboxyamino)imidazole ribonucleotide synthase [Pigmentibacter ruber]